MLLLSSVRLSSSWAWVSSICDCVSMIWVLVSSRVSSAVARSDCMDESLLPMVSSCERASSSWD